MARTTNGLVKNFGHNVQFRPKIVEQPEDESAVLEILTRHQNGKIRVVGSRHAWSPAIETTDVLVDLAKLDEIKITRNESGEVFVEVQGGCTIHRLIDRLRDQANVNLPSVGLITRQSIAGAVSTGTHGSGKSSLSHYVSEFRLATYDSATGQPTVRVIDGGQELLAARCSLGCLGIILSVKIKCVDRYLIEENTRPAVSLEDALQSQDEHPLQQFFLMPHSWQYTLQQRREVKFTDETQISKSAWLYHAYWFFWIDISFHVLITTVASLLRSKWLVHLMFRRLISWLVINRWRVTDYSEKMLVMNHHFFRHMEIELMVRQSQLAQAMDFVKQLLSLCDGATDRLSDRLQAQLQQIDLLDATMRLKGSYTHHYPICLRRMCPDQTLISMCSALDSETAAEDWFAISLITYVQPRDPFIAMSRVLAKASSQLFDARPHWGKHNPLSAADVEHLYPQLQEFREICQRFDPRGVFRNEYVQTALGFNRD